MEEASRTLNPNKKVEWKRVEVQRGPDDEEGKEKAQVEAAKLNSYVTCVSSFTIITYLRGDVIILLNFTRTSFEWSGRVISDSVTS